MSPRRTKAADHGFALIEALASLVIVGMIGLMLVAGVNSGRRVWDRIDGREAAGEVLDSAQTMLRARIEQTYPLTKNDENPPYIDFQGAPDGLTFLANPPEASRPAPLRRYRLLLDAGGHLVLASVSDAAPVDTPVVDRQILLTGARQMDIDYFGAPAAGQPARWQRLWRDRPSLPDVVRIRIAFGSGDARLWPDLLIHPRATIDAQCLLNIVTHHCKGRA